MFFLQLLPAGESCAAHVHVAQVPVGVVFHEPVQVGHPAAGFRCRFLLFLGDIHNFHSVFLAHNLLPLLCLILCFQNTVGLVYCAVFLAGVPALQILAERECHTAYLYIAHRVVSVGFGEPNQPIPHTACLTGSFSLLMRSLVQHSGSKDGLCFSAHCVTTPFVESVEGGFLVSSTYRLIINRIYKLVNRFIKNFLKNLQNLERA